MTAAVALEGLSFTYVKDGSPAVADVDLTVEPGEVLAVVGSSGSGKSTLLRLVNGLLRPTAGRVHVGGRDVTDVHPESRPVAMVFQGYALFPHLDVAANIGFGLAVRKAARSTRRQRVHEVADRLGLADLLHRMPAELSGGERQRVALARALLRDPVVFCLDEPLSALDPVLRTAARRDLDLLLRAEDRCALYVTHDQSEAMTLGDRIALLKDGRLEQVGTSRELYDDPATTFVAAFIGTHPMSLLPPRAARVDAGPGVVTIGVRAEHVELAPGDDAVVTAVDDLGHEKLVHLAVQDHRLVVQVGPGPTLRRGDQTGFAVRRHSGFDADGRRVA
ncbi:MAG: ABC transporter ATP-binding protein [Frankiaceae bacterium]|nr:ABC transporter ATP-binding protein [Frankiaceae bacterium]